MKKLFAIALAAGFISISSAVSAQEQDTASANYNYERGLEKTGDDLDEGAERTGDQIDQGTEKAGDKASEMTNEGAAHIKDEVFESKVGPEGQTIFINEHAQYYYIDDQGNKVMIDESELKDKPQDD